MRVAVIRMPRRDFAFAELVLVASFPGVGAGSAAYAMFSLSVDSSATWKVTVFFGLLGTFFVIATASLLLLLAMSSAVGAMGISP